MPSTGPSPLTFDIKRFEELGVQVEESWRSANYSDESFPKIATEALERAKFLEDTDPAAILTWLLSNPSTPQQQDALGHFGQPPVTLFYGPRFCIDVYFWMESTTTIHDHGFCGAFAVLKGSSVQTRYVFENRREINPHFYTGDIRCIGAEMLKPGEVRTIHSGEEFIHSVFHLEHPSVTICIRTHRSPTPQPQCDFYPPYFAQNPFFTCPVKSKELAAIHTLMGMEHPESDEIVKKTLASTDFQTAFSILRACWISSRGDQNEPRFQDWLSVVKKRHPELSERIIPTFSEIQRQGILLARRATVTKTEHRFFLAAFLTITNREAMIDFVRSQYPDKEPHEFMVDCLLELSCTQRSDSLESNVLGIDGIDADYLFVFECLLRGLSDDQLLEFCRENPAQNERPDEPKIMKDLAVRIRNTDIFSAQFRMD